MVEKNYEYLEIREEMEQKIKLLKDFAKYEGTEIGEYVYIICHAWAYAPSYCSEQMYKSLVDEINQLHAMINNDYEEREKSVTIKSYEYKNE